MKPILFDAGAGEWETNGLGPLSDALSCTVTEELNGQFELTMEYPVDGAHYDQLALRSIIAARAGVTGGRQPFRVYRITRPLNGVVTVHAQHLSYDLSGIPVEPFTASGAPAALQGLKEHAAADCPFQFWTDREGTAAFRVEKPSSLRSLLGGQEGSVLDLYGGEFEWDGWQVNLRSRRGADNGVAIRYGKNLTSLEQDENCANVYTGVYPYWAGGEDQLVQLPEKTLDAPGSYGYVKILALDLSQKFTDPPSEEQLRQAALAYMEDNRIGVPAVSLTVSFVQLEQTEEYKGLALLERVALGDTVSVRFARLGVAASARCVKTVYNVLLDRFDSIELGDARANLADTLAQQQKFFKDPAHSSALQQAVEALTGAILGARGGAVRLLDTNGDGAPDTLYIADDPDPTKAVKVWRFNYEGWGASVNGYNGPFKLGASLDTGFVADFMTTGTLNAALVKVINLIADHVLSKSGNYSMELNASHLSLKSGDSYRAYIWVNQPGGSQEEYGYIKLSKGAVDWPFPGYMGTDGRVTTVTPAEIWIGQDNDGDTQGLLYTHIAYMDELHLNRYGRISGEDPSSGAQWTSRGVVQDTVENVNGERINVLRLL